MVLVGELRVSSCPPFLRLRHDIAPDDGWLDVLVLRAEGVLQSLSAVLRTAGAPPRRTARGGCGSGRGQHGARREVLEARRRPMQLDGEPWSDAPFEARLLPAALPVIVDPATRAARRAHAWLTACS